MGQIYEKMDNYEMVVGNIKSFLLMQGIDPAKDLWAFLDKGYALTMRKTEAMLPEIAFYLDAGSSPTGAAKVMKTVYNNIEKFLVETKKQMDPDIMGMIAHKKVEAGNPDEYSLSMDFSKLSEEKRKDLSKELTAYPLLFSYGLDKNNLAYLKFGAAGTEANKTLAEDSEFEQGLGYIKGYERGVTYINVQNVIGFADRFVAMAKSQDGDAMKKDLEVYEIFKKYAAPFRSIVMGAGQLANDGSQMEAFIHIAK
jgi:hypothetical protein